MSETETSGEPEDKSRKPSEPAAKLLSRLIAQHCIHLSTNRPFHLFAIDCTPQPRPYSPTLADRGFVHSPNPTPGNKPITVGHQYSSLVYLPEKSQGEAPWVVPLLMQRVPVENKGNELGMQQLDELLNDDVLGFNEILTVGVADSSYSGNSCRKIGILQKNLVHIARMNSGRKVFSQPTAEQLEKSKNKRKFGNKMKLNDEDTHHKADEVEQFETVSAKGKKLTITVTTWNEMLVRGQRGFKSYQHPFTLVRVQVTDEQGKSVFKRALWLMVSGERRTELTTRMVYDSYRQRFDIEHFFRFGKQRLLLDKFQTPEVAHEENWWQLSMLSYVQLYLGRELGGQIIYPWERHLRENQNSKNPPRVASPSQTQRDFEHILNEAGTPSKLPVPRGVSPGRQQGETQVKRPQQPIVRKSKAKKKTEKKAVEQAAGQSMGVENNTNIPKPDNFTDLLESLKEILPKIGMTMEEFLAKASAEVPA